jgi:hypothetical protein
MEDKRRSVREKERVDAVIIFYVQRAAAVHIISFVKKSLKRIQQQQWWWVGCGNRLIDSIDRFD